MSTEQPTARESSGSILGPLRRVLPVGLLAAVPQSAVLLAAVLLAAVALGGCGSSAPPADRSAPISTPPPPITTDRGEIFNVTITSLNGQILVDKLEIEFNRRRGIHDIYGFYVDDYSQMAVIPFARIKRIDFQGQMPEPAFEQARVGREDKQLLLQNAFQVEITYWDGNRETFYAVIPMFRGEKDLGLWEYPMDSRSNAISYLEFNR